MKISSLVVLAIAIAIAGAPPLQAQTKKKRKKPAPTLIGGEVAPLKIMSRKQWNAKDPISVMTPHRPKLITIHHTATRQDATKALKVKMQNLQAFSQREDSLADGKKKPAWPDVPYHFYIASNGNVAEGRNIGFVGDTNTEYDPAGHILVTLEGNFENEDPTPEQIVTARRLIAFLAEKYQVPAEQIKTHKDYADTACPGKKLTSRIGELRGLVKKTK